jgi:hypothetical protein
VAAGGGGGGVAAVRGQLGQGNGESARFVRATKWGELFLFVFI